MSLVDAILVAVDTKLADAKELTSFVGSVVTTSPITVKQDGASTAITCLKLTGATLSVGSRVAVNLYGAQWVVLGVLTT